METHTYDEWKVLGFYVCKGQRCSGWNDEGKALFRDDQVAPLNIKRDALDKDEPLSIPRKENKFTPGKIWHTDEAPPMAYDPRGMPSADRMDYHMSMMNPNHQAIRDLESHLDSVFEKHHGGCLDDEDYGDW